MAEFPRLTAKGVVVKEYDSLASTNVFAQQYLATKGQAAACVIVAKTQTQGHGKQGRKFYSPRTTGAYFTVALPLSFFPAGMIDPGRLTITASVAAFKVLSHYFDQQIAIKWVNDLMVGNKKVVGILAEAATDDTNTIRGVVIGWGINLANPQQVPAALTDVVGGLSTGQVSDHTRQEIIDEVVATFFQLLDGPWSSVISVYQAHQFLTGKKLFIGDGDHWEEGQFDHITPEGYLVVQTETGIKTFSTGTIQRWWPKS